MKVGCMRSILQILVFFIIISTISFSQQAQDYFPTALGHIWNFEVVPLDTNNNRIDSLTTYQIDSFAVVDTFHNLEARYILSKSGAAATIKQQPYLDTNYVNFNGSTANIFFKVMDLDSILALIDTTGFGTYVSGLISFYNSLRSFEKWYPYFKFQQMVNIDYLIFQYDTTITIDTLTLPLRFEIKCRRLNDQTITTKIGQFTCKKFLETTTLAYLVNILPPPWPPVPVPLITRKDSIWFAPAKWMVKSSSPSLVIDLSLLNFGKYSLPGLEVEIIPEIPEPVSIKNDGEIASEFLLSQNYPNPFNPVTRISWQSPVSSHQTLKVYDILGNKVATLVDEYKPAGSYEVEFSAGSSGDASGLSSGIYFYRLNAGNFVETKKMVILR